VLNGHAEARRGKRRREGETGRLGEGETWGVGFGGWEDLIDVSAKEHYTCPMSDHDIQVLESQFPAISGEAFAAAREQVLASGQSVLQAEGGFVVRVFPDGRKELVKEIEPPTRLKSGSIYTIR